MNSRYSESFLALGLGSRMTRRRDEEHAIAPASSLALCEIPTTAAVDLWLRICICIIYVTRGRGAKSARRCAVDHCVSSVSIFYYLLICLAQSQAA